MLGVLVAVPGAYAATCTHGFTGPAVLTFGAADGTITLSQDAGELRYTVGAGASQTCHNIPAGTVATLDTTSRVDVHGSTGADTLVVDLTAGLFASSLGASVPVNSLSDGAEAVAIRLPDDDNVVLAGTLGADLDGDAVPNVTWTAGLQHLSITGGTGADDLELLGDGADLGSTLTAPATLSGGEGDDTLAGGFGADTFSGGAGEDLVTYADRTAGINASPNGVADDGLAGEGDNIGTDVEDLTGGSGNDMLTGNLRDNILDGGAGSDVVSGGRGADTLTGGPGNDAVAGGDGDDFLDEAAPGDGTDTLSGGDGSDAVDYSGRTAAVSLTIDGAANDGEAGEGDNIALDVEGATGGSGNDTVVGSSSDDTLDGGPGNDTVNGGAGADTISGSAGNDLVDGGPGDDTIDPGAGDDTAKGGQGDDEIDQPGAPSGLDDVADGSDLVDGGDGSDTASYAGRTLPVNLSFDDVRNDGQAGELDNLTNLETMVGGQANDVLAGGKGDDTITPGPGDDTVSGGAGEDAIDYSDRTQPVTVTLGAPGTGGAAGEKDSIASDVEDVTGGSGNDTITGSGGDNYLAAGAGNDTVSGGGGADDIDGGDGSDALDGGGGEDTADFSANTFGVTASLASGVATQVDANGNGSRDTLKGFEDLLGSDLADTLTGTVQWHRRAGCYGYAQGVDGRRRGGQLLRDRHGRLNAGIRCIGWRMGRCRDQRMVMGRWGRGE